MAAPASRQIDGGSNATTAAIASGIATLIARLVRRRRRLKRFSPGHPCPPSLQPAQSHHAAQWLRASRSAMSAAILLNMLPEPRSSAVFIVLSPSSTVMDSAWRDLAPRGRRAAAGYRVTASYPARSLRRTVRFRALHAESSVGPTGVVLLVTPLSALWSWSRRGMGRPSRGAPARRARGGRPSRRHLPQRGRHDPPGRPSAARAER